MSKKVVAISVVAGWIALFATEFLGLSGLIGDERPDISVSVRTTLTALTLVESSDISAYDEPELDSPIFGRDQNDSPTSEESLELVQFVKLSPHLYKLHETFRL